MEKKKILIDSIWSIGGHAFSLLIMLSGNIFLARLLSPREFGQLAIVMFFVSVLNVFTDGGMSGALVRKIERREQDYATVFTFNFVLSIILFFLVIYLAPIVAKFYNDPTLKFPIIIASSIIIISCFQTIQNVKILQNLKFRSRSIILLFSSLFSVLVGVMTAYFFDWGIYSLVAIPICNTLFQTVLYNMVEGFYFKIEFHKKSFQELFGFGINTTLVSVMNILFDNIYQLVLGKAFSLGQSGYFYQAKKLQDVPNNIVNNLSQGVFYSSLSKLQNDEDKMKTTYNLISSTFLWLIGLMVLIILIFGDEIINILLGENWSGAAYYIKFLIVGSLFYTQELVNKTLFKVYNKTLTLLKLEFVKKLFQILTLLIGVAYSSIEILLYGYIISNIFSYLLNHYFTNKIVAFGKKELGVFFKIILLLGFLIFLEKVIALTIHNLSTLYLMSFLLVFLYILISHRLRIINLKKVLKGSPIKI